MAILLPSPRPFAEPRSPYSSPFTCSAATSSSILSSASDAIICDEPLSGTESATDFTSWPSSLSSDEKSLSEIDSPLPSPELECPSVAKLDLPAPEPYAMIAILPLSPFALTPHLPKRPVLVHKTASYVDDDGAVAWESDADDVVRTPRLGATLAYRKRVTNFVKGSRSSTPFPSPALPPHPLASPLMPLPTITQAVPMPAPRPRRLAPPRRIDLSSVAPFRPSAGAGAGLGLRLGLGLGLDLGISVPSACAVHDAPSPLDTCASVASALADCPTLERERLFSPTRFSIADRLGFSPLCASPPPNTPEIASSPEYSPPPPPRPFLRAQRASLPDIFVPRSSHRKASARVITPLPLRRIPGLPPLKRRLSFRGPKPPPPTPPSLIDSPYLALGSMFRRSSAPAVVHPYSPPRSRAHPHRRRSSVRFSPHPDHLARTPERDSPALISTPRLDATLPRPQLLDRRRSSIRFLGPLEAEGSIASSRLDRTPTPPFEIGDGMEKSWLNSGGTGLFNPYFAFA